MTFLRLLDYNNNSSVAQKNLDFRRFLNAFTQTKKYLQPHYNYPIRSLLESKNDFKWKLHKKKERYEIQFKEKNRTEHENA